MTQMTPSNWATLIALLKCVVLYFALFNSVALAIRAWFAMANKSREEAPPCKTMDEALHIIALYKESALGEGIQAAAI